VKYSFDSSVTRFSRLSDWFSVGSWARGTMPLTDIGHSGSPICPDSDLIPILRSAILSYRNPNCSNLPVPYARSYRVLSSSVPRHRRFQRLHTSRNIIASQCRPRFGHDRFPAHALNPVLITVLVVCFLIVAMNGAFYTIVLF